MGTGRQTPSFPSAMLVVALILALALGARVVLLPDPRAEAGPGSSPSPSASPRAQGPAASPAPSFAAPTGVYANTGIGAFSPTVAGDRPLVYVPDAGAGMVEEIDPTTYKVVRRFKTGLYPQHITPSWDLKTLYVDVTTSSELVVIDPKTGKMIRTIHNIDHPYNLYFTPDGTKAITVAEYYNRLDFRNPHTFKLIKSVLLPCHGPDHADFSRDGSYFLISCEFDGTVVKVDANQMKVLGTIHVGGLPVDIKISPDGSVFFVANQGTNGVSVISAATDKVVTFIPTGKGAHGFAVSRDATELYVSNRLGDSISMISFATRKVVATWRVGGSPDMLQVSPDGTRLWFSNRYNRSVTVLDTATGQILKIIKVGANPHGLCYFPQPGRYSIGHNGVYR
jgi:YVTN family beta-propeller protein